MEGSVGWGVENPSGGQGSVTAGCLVAMCGPKQRQAGQWGAVAGVWWEVAGASEGGDGLRMVLSIELCRRDGRGIKDASPAVALAAGWVKWTDEKSMIGGFEGCEPGDQEQCKLVTHKTALSPVGSGHLLVKMLEQQRLPLVKARM